MINLVTKRFNTNYFIESPVNQQLQSIFNPGGQEQSAFFH